MTAMVGGGAVKSMADYSQADAGEEWSGLFNRRRL